MPSATSRQAPVIVRTDGAAVILELSDCLDPTAGRSLVDAVAAAVATGPDRVDIDLRSIAEWTVEGAAALVQCRELCRELPNGLHYRTGRGPGREALLAAYA
jgi:hypothetical protein